MQFLRSSGRFLWRVFRRAAAAIVWWLLDVSDLYAKFVEPHMPAKTIAFLQPVAGLLSSLTPYIVGVIFLGAVLFTYYEADRERHRSPKISKKLKDMYKESGDLLRQIVSDDQELFSFKQDSRDWFVGVRNWIKDNMEPATLTRFQHFQHSLPYNHGNALNDEHQKTLNGINIYHKNLQAIIDSQEWR